MFLKRWRLVSVERRQAAIKARKLHVKISTLSRTQRRIQLRQNKEENEKKGGGEVDKQGRIHGYPSRVRVGWGSDGEGRKSIWVGAVGSESSKTPKK